MFYKKELQKTNQNEFRIEKVINRKGNKLYVKCKGYEMSYFSEPAHSKNEITLN